MVGKVRVHEVAAEHGADAKVALRMLRDLGEYVKSPSSTLQPPVARRLRARLHADGFRSDRFPGLDADTARTLATLFVELPRSLPRLVDELRMAGVRGGAELEAARLAQQVFYVAPQHHRPVQMDAPPARLGIHLLPGGHGLLFAHQSATLGHVILWRNEGDRVQLSAFSVEVYEENVAAVFGYTTVRVAAEGEDLVSATPAFRGLTQAWEMVPVRVRGFPSRREPAEASFGPRPGGEDTQLIRYRRDSERPSEQETKAEARRARTRWTVRGHWRNQYYRGSDEYRRVWIEEHTAGAPDVGVTRTDRVFVIAPSDWDSRS